MKNKGSLVKYKSLHIPDVVLLTPEIHGDCRGFFMETFRQDCFNANVGHGDFVQDNHSSSAQGVLRGLHYQIRRPQGKLVRVIAGMVFDVAVDLRRSSPYFGQWASAVLSAENREMLWVPPGFAHGFYVLSEQAEFVYKCTEYYAPEYERSILWNDPDIGIDWPLMGNSLPIVSDRDKNAVSFDMAQVFP